MFYIIYRLYYEYFSLQFDVMIDFKVQKVIYLFNWKIKNNITFNTFFKITNQQVLYETVLP